MDGVRRALTILSTAAVVSTVAVNCLQQPQHDQQQQQQQEGVVWYPSVRLGRQPPILSHSSQHQWQPLLHQHLVFPALPLQWQRNGTYHSARHVPRTSPDERCSHSSHDEGHPHSSDDERHHSSLDEGHPHSSDDERHDSSLDERHLHSSDDEQYPYFSQEQYPHSPQEEYPPFPQVQYPDFPLEMYPHSSEDDQHPHSPQDELHFLASLPSDEYDLRIGPPVLQGHDHFTTMASASDTSDQLEPVRHYDLSKLSFAAKEQLKSVGSLEELLQVPGVSQLLKDEDELENLGAWTTENPYSYRSSRMYRTRGQRRREEQPPNAGCEVEKATVVLKTQPGTRLLPSCVRVGRCGGCCSPGRTCTPTAVNTRSVKVIELSDNLRESRSVSRKVDEAVGCRCECKVRASDCDLTVQEYDPQGCMCVCKRSLEKEQAWCEASPKHQWHPYRCACICAGVGSRECSTGHTFYEDICRCEATRQE